MFAEEKELEETWCS